MSSSSEDDFEIGSQDFLNYFTLVDNTTTFMKFNLGGRTLITRRSHFLARPNSRLGRYFE